MKATINYKKNDGRNGRKTIDVSKNEPNQILREFASFVREVNKYTCVSTIKCGRYVYEWKGNLFEAGVE